MSFRSTLRRLSLGAAVLIFLLGVSAAYWKYQTWRIEVRVLETGKWLKTHVVQNNPVILREMVGGSRRWSGITPLFCFLTTPAGKEIVVEVWIDSNLLDAQITRVRCHEAFSFNRELDIDLPPKVVSESQPVNLQAMFPSAFTKDGDE